MRRTKAVTSILPCLVLRDRREREETDKWEFRRSAYCAGTQDIHMATGDYTLKGFEAHFAIERKGTVKDLVQSMVAPRFKEELMRMSALPHSFVIMEFGLEDLRDWPVSSGCGYGVQRKLPLRHRGAAMAAYLGLRLGFPEIDFIFAGTCGKLMAGNIFKRIIEAYAAEIGKLDNAPHR